MTARRKRKLLKRHRGAEAGAVGKRRAPAAAEGAPADSREAQLALASLLDSMTAEAASLQRQLNGLVVSDSSSSQGVGTAAAAPAATSGTAPADVERRLAALSSSLGRLTLCLRSVQPLAGTDAGADRVFRCAPAGQWVGLRAAGAATPCMPQPAPRCLC